MTAHEEFERRFHELLGRMVHAHASLDFNVGLQLSWLGPHLGRKVNHLLDARKVSFAKRLKKLRTLVIELYGGAGAEVLGAFRAWFSEADSLKALRNDYVHGRWGVPDGRLEDGTQTLGFVPLHWDFAPGRVDDSVRMTLPEFESQVKKMEALVAQYFRLERQHLEHAKSRQAL